MSRGRKSKTNSPSLGLAGFSSSPASARSGWAKVAKETLSPKFDLMNSESLVCSSSGVGKGGFWFIKKKGRRTLGVKKKRNILTGHVKFVIPIRRGAERDLALAIHAFFPTENANC